jgi:hypothetical protein
LIQRQLLSRFGSRVGSDGFHANRNGVQTRQLERSGMACARAFQVQGEVLGALFISSGV